MLVNHSAPAFCSETRLSTNTASGARPQCSLTIGISVDDGLMPLR